MYTYTYTCTFIHAHMYAYMCSHTHSDKLGRRSGILPDWLRDPERGRPQNTEPALLGGHPIRKV